MSEQTPELDTEELTQLALQAVRADRAEDAIRLLKKAVFRDPQRADLRYLLGARHVQIGLVARGIEEIGEALALAPGLHPARFQLGLLHFSGGEFARAEEVWAPLLEALPEDDALRLFVVGLNLLARDDLAACVALLQQGIARCGSANLNADMQRVIAEAEALLAAQAGRGGVEPGVAPSSGWPRHVLLSRYEAGDDTP